MKIAIIIGFLALGLVVPLPTLQSNICIQVIGSECQKYTVVWQKGIISRIFKTEQMKVPAVTPNPIPAQGFVGREYINDEWGFSIQLPEGYSVKPGDYGEGMFDVTSLDGKSELKLQASRVKLVFKDWISDKFGKAYVNQFQVNGNESRLVRINDNNRPVNTSFDVQLHVYRNPILYQLYAQQLPLEHVESFKSIAESFKTVQSPKPFEFSMVDNRSVEKFDLVPQKVDMTNWQRFTDADYQITIKHPTTWMAKVRKYEYENRPTFQLSVSDNSQSSVWLRIGDYAQFSTAGGVVCYDQICENVGEVKVTIKGVEYRTPIIRGSYNKQNDPNQNVFLYYAFQFPLNQPKVKLVGYDDPVAPYVSGNFYNKIEGQMFVNMLSGMSF